MKKIYNIFYFLIIFLIASFFREIPLSAQVVISNFSDSIAGHPAYYETGRQVLSWYRPEVPGAGYDHVIRLASEFMKEGVPVEPRTGEKLYFVTCCFQGPHMQNSPDAINGILPEDWMHNPACVFAGSVHSLALGYRVYAGDDSYSRSHR